MVPHSGGGTGGIEHHPTLHGLSTDRRNLGGPLGCVVHLATLLGASKAGTSALEEGEQSLSERGRQGVQPAAVSLVAIEDDICNIVGRHGTAHGLLFSLQMSRLRAWF